MTEACCPVCGSWVKPFAPESHYDDFPSDRCGDYDPEGAYQSHIVFCCGDPQHWCAGVTTRCRYGEDVDEPKWEGDPAELRWVTEEAT